MKKPILFSFFSGSGFLDLGFEHSGFNVGFVNEFHEAFLNAYKHSRIKMKIKEPYYGYHNGDI
ncbi:modification methylase NmeDIP, partial [Escherichia coli]|nr:modification methylase NmeDIP [Escherichia coli]